MKHHRSNFILRAVAALLFAPLLFIAGPVAAATTSGTLNVKVTVQSACNLSAPDLDFLTYTPSSPGATTARSDLSITCTKGTPITIKLGAGQSGNVAARAMVNGSDTLSYALFSDSSHTTAWTDTSAVTDTADGTAKTYTVFGLIGAGQYGVTPGTYTDAVSIDIDF